MMKKLFLIAIGIAFVLSSCVRHVAVVPGSYISADFDEVSTTFSVIDTALYSSSNGLNALTLTAATGTADSCHALQIRIFSSAAITSGSTYTYPAESNPGESTPSLTYKPTLNGIYSYNWFTDLSGAPPLIITITTITATHVTGTFSGAVVSQQTGTVKVITNGKFDLDLQQ